jgi:hypothetical protein
MRYAVLLLLATALLAGLALAYDRTHVIAWVGGYAVHVRTERAGPRPIRAADVALLFRAEWAAAEGDPGRIDSGWKPVAVVDGGSFVVEVKCSGKDSGFGRQISYARQEVLVLRVGYADGGNELVAADLPESHSSRELLLRVP